MFKTYDDDEGRDCDGATVELVTFTADQLIGNMPMLPMATGPATTLPNSYTSYPHKYGMVWMHDSHVSVEFQRSKCDQGSPSDPRPSAQYLAQAWLDAHPDGQKTGRWPTRYVIRHNH